MTREPSAIRPGPFGWKTAAPLGAPAMKSASWEAVARFTHGTLAPNADDIELRVNTTDANSAAMQIRDIITAPERFEIAIMSEAFFGSDWGI